MIVKTYSFPCLLYCDVIVYPFPSTTPVIPKDDEYSENYEEDFEIPTSHSQSSLSSSNSTSTITPANTHSKSITPSGTCTANDGISSSVHTSHELHKQKMVETNSRPHATTEVNVSGSSVGSTQSVKRLLHRSSHSSTLRTKEQHQLLGDYTSQSTAGFNLSPIHTQVHTEHSVDESVKGSPRQNPEVPTRRSLSTEPEERHSLTPIYPKDLTTSSRLREHPQSGTKNQPTKTTLHSVGGFSLSPIHALDCLVQGTNSDVGFDGPLIKSSDRLSKQSPTFSPIKEPSTYVHKGSLEKEAEMESSLPLRQSILDEVPQPPHQLKKHVVVKSPTLDPRGVRNNSHFGNNAEKAIDSQLEIKVIEDGVVLSDPQSGLPDDSYVADLTELQNALEAAGLPRISTVEEKSGTADAPRTTQISNLDGYTSDVSNVASTGKVLEKSAGPEQMPAKQVDKPVTTVQDEMEFPSTIHRDEKHEASDDELLASLLQGDSLVLQSNAISSETKSQDGSTTASVHVQPDIEVKGTKSVLREAVRALANEELASITRDILRGGDETKRSMEPVSDEHSMKTDHDQKSLPSQPKQSPHQIHSHLHQRSAASLPDKQVNPKRSSSVSNHQVEGACTETTAASMSTSEGREGSETRLKQELSDILKSNTPSVVKKSNQKSLAGKSAPLLKAKMSTRDARTSRFSSQPQRPQVKANTDRFSQSVNKNWTSGIPSSKVNTHERPVSQSHAKPPTSSRLTHSKPSSSNHRVSTRAKSATTAHASEKLKREDSSIVVIPTARTESFLELDVSDDESCGHSNAKLDTTDQAVLWKKAWQDEKACTCS